MTYLESISNKLYEQKVDKKTLEKWQSLIQKLQTLDSAIISYSGGVDSTFLAYVASLVMAERSCAIYINTGLDPVYQKNLAKQWAIRAGFCFRILEYPLLQNPQFVKNPPNRCYICKLSMLNLLQDFAKDNQYKVILEGQNADDLNDYRPGRQAVIETGTLSPLAEVGLAKTEIRILSRILNLPVWDLPSSPCLATRFPYNNLITEEGLQRVQSAEQFLTKLGFRNIRVRMHQDLARIEVDSEEIVELINNKEEVVSFFNDIGFLYISVDLKGYRQGSLNEGVKNEHNIL
ncbi:TPA: ATP-dependent sacrificial sulfur transferase LarE [Candidatus Poribacteria bacterium]|nr:ATP-dependent sacrificial sulfur transferase LarE [Candidatus Poribacteria bacterium]